ncbi:glycoside hydrolase family 97 protein [Pedobacter sp. SYP-B3415]|uniref:glycoside hydrolase family 97 protein n=1 Tax=Pedobacter sp. SYP-B3415 TaxID=2496641 RepID=UPI001F118F45|nr:glycoside hydrolase family 97 protein [Pedobacter sp. SYP-B3415]
MGFTVKAATLVSPDGKIKVEIQLTDKIYYSLYQNDRLLLAKCQLGMTVDQVSLGTNPKLISQRTSKITEQIRPAVPLKFSSVQSTCNVLVMKFRNGFTVEFRAFNDGVAYRILTELKGDKTGKVKIKNENITLNVADNHLLHLQPAKDFTSNYETNYTHELAKDWIQSKAMATLPALIDTKNGNKILFAETDLSDYPCLFLKGADQGLVSAFSGVALEEKQQGDRFMRITKEADYIALTNGKRSFPWRYFIITTDDRQLIETTIPVKLAPKPAIQNTGWIRPGQVSWEWWNAASPYGQDVNFVSGFNLDTYKYYIDFAAKNGVPYIIMDEGWAETVHDPFTPNKKVDLHELIRYGKTKKVDIILWLTWLSVEKNMGLFKTFSEWGIKGVKIDFMDRNDQWMVNYYERVAKEAAKYGLLVDFHGSFTPKGLEHKYPNLISYEGVRGLEQMEGCQPKNTIYLPFIRNVVGPMDFTPGAMINMQPEVFGGKRPNSASVGTRAYQLALFVIFESGVQMLCDNPTQYYKNQDCTDFITQVPVTWDETKALVAEAGEVVVVAKRKGAKWFIGGITNGQSRDLSIDLNFLDKNKSYKIISYSDGINANRQAMDYKVDSLRVNSESHIPVKLSRNGGFAAIISL